MPSFSPPVKRALISVSDKTGLVEFARELVELGVAIFSSGGTSRHLQAAGLAVREVSDYTGFPEIMDGRVKTLHPRIHGGILCRHDHPGDRQALCDHGIETFELVVVNLYPFEATVARPGTSDEEAIEQIDIGGPSLVRGAAKNHAFVAVATSPEQYAEITAAIRATGTTNLELRRRLAGAAFDHTARYDRAIADYFARTAAAGPFPAALELRFERRSVLRYGENPHQQAALYVEPSPPQAGIAQARQLGEGKELSYNNLLDLDSALAVARSLPAAGAAVIKHNNPCGAAAAESLAEALEAALAGDPQSAFGSVLGLNRTVDRATAEVLCRPGLFVEAIVAPEFEPAALEHLRTLPKWRSSVRLLAVGPLGEPDQPPWEYRRIGGGLLVQTADVASDPVAEWTVVTRQAPTSAQRRELELAWAVVRHVKSNAIVLVNRGAVAGVGAGQMSRVDSVELAIRKAGHRAEGSVLASDAFFPFPDSIQQAAAAGIAAIIQPGGSRRDDEVVAVCDEHGLAMIFTGRRHFKH